MICRTSPPPHLSFQAGEFINRTVEYNFFLPVRYLLDLLNLFHVRPCKITVGKYKFNVLLEEFRTRLECFLPVTYVTGIVLLIGTDILTSYRYLFIRSDSRNCLSQTFIPPGDINQKIVWKQLNVWHIQIISAIIILFECATRYKRYTLCYNSKIKPEIELLEKITLYLSKIILNSLSYIIS